MAAARAAVCAAVRLLRGLSQSIQDYDQQIDDLAQTHPISSSLLRYRDAAELQEFSGIAPATETSGNQHRVHWRWSCPKFLRQTSGVGRTNDSTMRLGCGLLPIYQVQRDDKKKSDHAAVRSPAYKWIRIVVRCWKDRKPYDESRYEDALKRQQQKAAAKSIQPSPFELPVQWISCAGFQEIASKNGFKECMKRLTRTPQMSARL